MAVDATDLIARYPELSAAYTAYPDMVDACLADARSMVDSGYYGTKADMAILAYAAHLIAINPLGELARLDKRSDKTVYSVQFDQIKRSLGAGCRAI